MTTMPHDHAPPHADLRSQVDAHIEYLYRFAMHRVNDAATAEEIVQETLLAALQSEDGFDGRSTLRTWLTSILKHKIADSFRKRANREIAGIDRLVEWSDDLFGGRGTWNQKRGAWPPFPADEAERAELVGEIQACLGRLPSHVAEAFVLCEQRGVAPGRIASTIGVATGTLWTRLYRARLALRECLHEKWLGEGR